MHWTNFLALALPACTSLTFHSRGLIPLSVGPLEKHETPVEVRGIKQFYLWGLVGPDSLVEMDRELANAGIASAAGVKVHYHSTFESLWKSWISLGMYLPTPYKISAFSDQSGHIPFLKREFPALGITE